MRQRINVSAGGGMLLKRMTIAPAGKAQISASRSQTGSRSQTSRAQGRCVGRGANGANPQTILHMRRLMVQTRKSVLGKRPAQQSRHAHCVIVQRALASGWRKVLTLRRAQDAAPGAPPTRLAYRSTRTGRDVPAIAKSSAIIDS